VKTFWSKEGREFKGYAEEFVRAAYAESLGNHDVATYHQYNELVKRHRGIISCGKFKVKL